MWKGDQVAACVAAASIVAKVTRDRIMTALDEQYPGVRVRRHKGYSTRATWRALDAYGPCPVHRMSFVNVSAGWTGAAAQAAAARPRGRWTSADGVVLT